jgi:hypothetical protein
VPEGDLVVDNVTGEVSCRDGSVTMEIVASGSSSKALGKCFVPLSETWHTGGFSYYGSTVVSYPLSDEYC